MSGEIPHVVEHRPLGDSPPLDLADALDLSGFQELRRSWACTPDLLVPGGSRQLSQDRFRRGRMVVRARKRCRAG